MEKEIAIGVDVGGSHVSCAAYNLVDKKLISNTLSESDLDSHASADEIIAAWGGVIKQTLGIVGLENVEGIGFAMPGPFDYPSGISLMYGETGKYENTYGMNVASELRKYLQLPNNFKIRFINDATALAVAEAQIGKAKGFSRSLSVTFGTGFGSAFIKDGLPVVKSNEVPKHGCVWHLPFNGSIADDYFSTRGFIKRFEDGTGIKVGGVKDIAESAKTNAFAKNMFTEFGHNIGVFLKPWIEKFGIETLVMGGNISRAYSLYSDSLDAFLKEENIQLKVSVSELKETAAFVGAAILIDDGYYELVKPSLKYM